MTPEIKTISPSASLGEARATMKLSRIRHLLVREGRQIVGVVSDRDFGVLTAANAQQRVADVMTGDLVTATPETTVRQAANLFRGRSIGCLPVLEDGKPVGIVTTTDLLELIGRGSERPIERSTRWTLRDRGPRRAGSTSRRARQG